MIIILVTGIIWNDYFISDIEPTFQYDVSAWLLVTLLMIIIHSLLIINNIHNNYHYQKSLIIINDLIFYLTDVRQYTPCSLIRASWFETKESSSLIYSNLNNYTFCQKSTENWSISCADSLKMLQKAYGESTFSKTRLYEWYSVFKTWIFFKNSIA